MKFKIIKILEVVDELLPIIGQKGEQVHKAVHAARRIFESQHGTTAVTPEEFESIAHEWKESNEVLIDGSNKDEKIF